MSVTQWVIELSNGTDDPDYYGPFPGYRDGASMAR